MSPTHPSLYRDTLLANSTLNVGRGSEKLQTQHGIAPSLLSGQNTLITGGTFTQVLSVAHYGTGLDHGLQTLSKEIAPGALHDSLERHPPPKFDSDNHNQVIKDILDRTKDDSSKILWVSGPANSGKTAIGQVIAGSLAASGRLAGSFFFDKNKSRRDNGDHLFSTLAYQIAIKVPGMRKHINSAMEDDPTYPSKSTSVQMQTLIVEPYRKLVFSSIVPPLISIIIIDALDECRTERTQSEILKLLFTEVAKTPPIPLRFLIFSRPEKHLRDTFHSSEFSSLVSQIFLKPDLDLPYSILSDDFCPSGIDIDRFLSFIDFSTPPVPTFSLDIHNGGASNLSFCEDVAMSRSSSGKSTKDITMSRSSSGKSAMDISISRSSSARSHMNVDMPHDPSTMGPAIWTLSSPSASSAPFTPTFSSFLSLTSSQHLTTIIDQENLDIDAWQEDSCESAVRFNHLRVGWAD